MPKNPLFTARSYLKHWLLKMDRYSLQSPYIFSVYQGAIDLIKKESLSDKKTKVNVLIPYFCQLTPANQVGEFGFGNQKASKQLEQITKGEFHRLSETKLILEKNEFSKPIPPDELLDFVLIHPPFPETLVGDILSSLLTRMQPHGILFFHGIHTSQEMETCWKSLQSATRIRLTLDFFDFGVAFLSYPGPKTNLKLAY
uniref:hypothetical protein n=1 Tax=Algoriphagus sp. TaxID=1872435 RepID=UPI004047DA64